MLEGLKLTPDQFVDLCILCGCDYLGTIKGARPGPPRACGEPGARADARRARGGAASVGFRVGVGAERAPTPERGAGIGGVRALTLIQKHGTLEKVLAGLDPAKYELPQPFPYDEARRMFKGAPR